MKYVAFLRGVNVGGKSKINMTELKSAFQKAGFENVLTYINSGNILFESKNINSKDLTNEIETFLQKGFFPIDAVVISEKDLHEIVANVPEIWKHEDVRKYIGFIKPPAKPEDVLAVAQLNEEVDSLDKGPNVIYMTTKMSGLTTSGFPKLIAKPIYKSITIRNFNTVEKLIKLMEN